MPYICLRAPLNAAEPSIGTDFLSRWPTRAGPMGGLGTGKARS